MCRFLWFMTENNFLSFRARIWIKKPYHHWLLSSHHLTLLTKYLHRELSQILLYHQQKVSHTRTNDLINHIYDLKIIKDLEQILVELQTEHWSKTNFDHETLPTESCYLKNHIRCEIAKLLSNLEVCEKVVGDWRQLLDTGIVDKFICRKKVKQFFKNNSFKNFIGCKETERSFSMFCL